MKYTDAAGTIYYNGETGEWTETDPALSGSKDYTISPAK